MNIIFEEFSALIVIPFVIAMLAGFGMVLDKIIDLGCIYSLG